VLFDTPIFFAFLVLVLLVYWRLSWRRQNVMLLVASYFFYGWWDWRFLSLIMISTVVDYHCAKYIARSEEPWRRRTLLTISLALNLTFLGFFKYFNFFEDSLVQVLHTMGIHYVPFLVLRIILPPGISFYTFQEIAYIVDVYNRKLKASERLVDYALFIALFPHLIAGPIQRPSHLLPQVQKPRVYDSEKFFSGMMLILTGLFRKCVVADNCGLIANAAFGGKFGEPGLAVLALGTYAFAWQIYGDFSGYSDIARGTAQLMGFHFMVNFRQPYLARSLQEFWRRWHISLSTWLRDYLYIGLGGQSPRRGPDLPEPDGDHAAGRALAWGELGLRDLGRNSWGRAGGGALLSEPDGPREEGNAGPAVAVLSARLGVACDLLPPGVSVVDFLPGPIGLRRVPLPGWIWPGGLETGVLGSIPVPGDVQHPFVSAGSPIGIPLRGIPV
jgi:D-alanyl-lipoteichoic acid acyltransferase DltB (MBOAT superfamily)